MFSGMGQTLFEECVIENGQVLNPSLLDYKLPRPFEVPELKILLLRPVIPMVLLEQKRLDRDLSSVQPRP